MATHAANDLSYYLLIADQFKSDLAGIRKWNNLRVGFDTGSVWIRDLDYVQVNSVEVKSIPYKTLFYEKDGKLYLQNSLLPDRNIPSLLWTPIERALPVKLPPFNHNYFGISEQVAVRIVPSAAESPSNVLVTGDLGLGFVNGAPVYALGGGAEMAVTSNFSVRGDVQAISYFGHAPSSLKTSVGLIWHFN